MKKRFWFSYTGALPPYSLHSNYIDLEIVNGSIQGICHQSRGKRQNKRRQR